MIKNKKNREFASKVLYISSTAFIAIGLFCAFAEWYEKQTMEAILGAIIIQVVGIVGYFIARILSEEKAPFYVNWLNIIGIAFYAYFYGYWFYFIVDFQTGVGCAISYRNISHFEFYISSICDFDYKLYCFKKTDKIAFSHSYIVYSKEKK